MARFLTGSLLETLRHYGLSTLATILLATRPWLSILSPAHSDNFFAAASVDETLEEDIV